MTFQRKAITATITLGGGPLGNNPSSAIVLTGYRIQADMKAYGGESQGLMHARIYGVSLDLANQLTTIGPIQTVARLGNTIQVAAGDFGTALNVVFEGTINSAWASFHAPDMCVDITATTTYGMTMLPTSATSFKGTFTIGQIITIIVGKMNQQDPNLKLSFINSGVNVSLTDMYLPGSGWDQIRAVCQAAACNYKVDQGVLTVSSKGVPIQQAGAVPVVSPTQGLVGYPTFSQAGIEFRALYMPGVQQGSEVILQGSAITAANATWFITSVSHDLESETPGGAWFTTITGTKVPT